MRPSKLKGICLAIVILLWSSFAYADYFSAPPIWGASFQYLSLIERGLVRTYYGLDSFQKTRIAKFCKDTSWNGEPARIYFNFKSNRLYEIEVSFKRPTAETVNRLAAQLEDHFGEASSRNVSALPAGELFIFRQIVDYQWETESSHINMRARHDQFMENFEIRSLFVTIREKETSQKNVPVRMKSDKEILEENSTSLKIAFVGAMPLSGSRLSKHTMGPLTGILAETDIAVAYVPTRIALADRTFTKALSSVGFNLVAVPSHDGKDMVLYQLAAGNALPVSHLELIINQSKIKIGLTSGFVSKTSREKLIERIHSVKEKSDMAIALPVWPDSANSCPTAMQKTFVDDAFEAGANIIVGYHPRYLQPTFGDKKKLALFSPGILFHPDENAPKNLLSLAMIIEVNRGGLIGYDLKPIESTKDADGKVILSPIGGEKVGEVLNALPRMGGTCK